MVKEEKSGIFQLILIELDYLVNKIFSERLKLTRSRNHNFIKELTNKIILPEVKAIINLVLKRLRIIVSKGIRIQVWDFLHIIPVKG